MSFLTKSYKDWREDVAVRTYVQTRKQEWDCDKKNALSFEWTIEWTYPIADIDNIKSGIYDALEGIVMLNDCQVDREPRTRLILGKEKIIHIEIKECGVSKWVYAALSRKWVQE